MATEGLEAGSVASLLRIFVLTWMIMVVEVAGRLRDELLQVVEPTRDLLITGDMIEIVNLAGGQPHARVLGLVVQV